MHTLDEKFCELSEEKQRIQKEELALRLQRRQQIGWLAEQYGLLALPDNELVEAFKNLAVNHYNKQVYHV